MLRTFKYSNKQEYKINIFNHIILGFQNVCGKHFLEGRKKRREEGREETSS